MGSSILQDRTTFLVRVNNDVLLFSVALYQVSFSPHRNMWHDIDHFVLVIRRPCQDLDGIQLGQDPAPTLLPIHPSDTYPSYQVRGPPNITAATSESSPTIWCTTGRPIWSSVSLFGTGTVVWAVHPCDEEGPYYTTHTVRLSSSVGLRMELTSFSAGTPD